MRRMCRQVAHRPMREGWDSWAFAIERIEIISQKCTAALESCLFQQFVSGGLRSCASFMTRHSTDESCSLVISLSGVAGVILGNTNERIHICGRWAPRASCEVGRAAGGRYLIGAGFYRLAWPAADSANF